ncbi:hypothetical protein Tco_0272835 [Tanacetum coccineum]
MIRRSGRIEQMFSHIIREKGKKMGRGLKTAIKAWSKNAKNRTYVDKSEINNKLSYFDKKLDQGGYNKETLNERSTLMKDIHDLESLEALEIAQKARVHWSIEGDENTKHFHDILNNKRSQLANRRIFVDREWITDPYKVKSDFLVHFSNRFAKPNLSRIKIDFPFPNRLSSAQDEEMKRIVSYDETKHVVWDCGTNKSPGPDGFSFEFFHKLSFVIADIISEVQSAFVPNRQILDGPFILNELISWCKHKKHKALIFKVDFEKPFDSVRWDYLDDVLKSVCFGDK